MTVFPPTMFQVYADYDGQPACYLDNTASFSEALDHFIAAYEEGREPRVIQMDFDIETNRLESARGVTDEFLAAMHAGAIAAE